MNFGRFSSFLFVSFIFLNEKLLFIMFQLRFFSKGFFVFISVYRSFGDLHHEAVNTCVQSYPALLRFFHCVSQVVVRSESLPAPGDWDQLLSGLSFRPPHLLSDDEFLPESAFRDLLASASGDTTARVALVAVCRNFFVTLCHSLQSSPYSRSSLARGLSSFDPDGVINGSELTQIHSFRELLVVLEAHGWTLPSENASLVEAYRSFVGSLRSNGATYDGSGAHAFIAGREELQVNRGLHSVFCLVSLYSTRRPQTFPDVTIPLEGSSLHT